MYKVVKKSDGKVRKIADTHQAINYITKEISPNVSFALTEANNHKEIETTLYDRIYFVLEGTITLVFNGKKVILEKDDSIFISKNTTYEISGTFRSVIVNHPAFGVESK